MKKFGLVLFTFLLTALSLQSSHAASDTTANFISQSRVWVNEKTNVTFNFTESTDNGISNAEIEISKQPLLGRSAVRNIIDNPKSVDYELIYETPSIVQSENLYSFIVPGSRFKFSGAGTYALRITVYVRGEAQKITSFIAYFPKNTSIKKLNVSTVFPLTIKSGLTPTDTILNDKSADSFLPNKSMNSILDLGKSIRNVTWLLDPDTIKLAQVVSANTEISRPEPHELNAEQIGGAQNWLGSLLSVANTENSFVIPSEDTLALKNSNLNRLAKMSISNTRHVKDYFGGSNFKLVTVPQSGGYSDDEISWLQNQNINFNIYNSLAFPAQNSVFTPNGVVQDGYGDKAPVVDNYSSKLFTDAISGEIHPGMYQAAFTGDLLITALEQPSRNRFMVVMPDTNTSGITNAKFASAISALNAPWISNAKLREFTSQGIGSRNRESTSNKFSKEPLAIIKNAKLTKSNLASLIAGAVEETQIDSAMLRLANLGSDKKTKSQIQKETQEFLAELNDAVRIMSSGSVVFPSESARVPITVRNDLSVAISIRIITSGLPAVRVIPEPVAEMTIAPGRRESIEIPTRLIGTDTAYLKLQIVDLENKRIGAPILIQVSSSAYAQAAAWVVGAAFALLLLFAIRNTVKRVRSSREGSRENMKL